MKKFLGDLCESMLDWFAPLLIILLICALVVGFPMVIYVAYQESKSPVIEIRKDEWVVTHYRERAVTTYVMCGKVMIPVTTYEKIPDQYTLK